MSNGSVSGRLRYLVDAPIVVRPERSCLTCRYTTEPSTTRNLFHETLAKLVTTQQGRTAELEGRLVDLERRVGRHPRNSSMLPAAEGLTKRPVENRAARRAAKRKPGKQPGAEGTHFTQVTDPDEGVVHTPGSCRGCGAGLGDGELVDVETRQVFELPRILPYVTEHRLERGRCTCGWAGKAVPPPKATAPACYGPRVRALACCFAGLPAHPLPERIAELFADALGMEISSGASVSMVAEAGGRLGLFLEVVKDLLADAPAVHFNEVGSRSRCTGRTWPRQRPHIARTATSGEAPSRSTRSASCPR